MVANDTQWEVNLNELWDLRTDSLASMLADESQMALDMYSTHWQGGESVPWNTLKEGDRADAPRFGPFEWLLDTAYCHVTAIYQLLVDCWTLNVGLALAWSGWQRICARQWEDTFMGLMSYRILISGQPNPFSYAPCLTNRAKPDTLDDEHFPLTTGTHGMR